MTNPYSKHLDEYESDMTKNSQGVYSWTAFQSAKRGNNWKSSPWSNTTCKCKPFKNNPLALYRMEKQLWVSVDVKLEWVAICERQASHLYVDFDSKIVSREANV